jgi:hypothetical protein
MTLAYYGKSKQRRGMLFLLALAAVFGALAASGGVALQRASAAPTSRTINVCKVVLDNGDAVLQHGTFSFSTNPAATSPSNPFTIFRVEGQAKSCTEVTVSDGSVTVTETPPIAWTNFDSNWPKFATGTSTTSVSCDGAQSVVNSAVTLSTDDTVLFCNKAQVVATGQLHIIKVNDGGTASDPFKADIAGGETGIVFSQSSPVTRTLPVGTYSVSEQQPNAGYDYQGFTFYSDGPTCNTSEPSLGSTESNVIVYEGADTTICFYNKKKAVVTRGHVIVKKVKDTTAGVPAADLTPFSGAIVGPETVSWGPIPFNGEDFIASVLTGSYSLSEDAPANGWSLLGYALGTPSFVEDEQVADCPTDPANYNLTSFNVNTNATTVVCVMNTKVRQPQVVNGSLTIHKVITDGSSDTSTNFTGSVSGGLSATFTDLRTDHDKQYSVPVTVGQTVNLAVAENDPSGLGYARIGYKVTTSTTACGLKPDTTGASASVAFDQDNLVKVVCVYNEPRVNIKVVKTIAAGSTQNLSGWTFTLSGCSITPVSKTTDGTGIVTFTGLAPANSCTYTVTESVKLGWSVDGGNSQPAAPKTAGQTVTLTFVNREFSIPELKIPPATVTQPVVINTPAPTATPTEPPKKKTDDVVSADKPAGAPKPPQTGSGFGSDSGTDTPFFLVIGALMAAVTGMTFIALGRKR